MSDPAGTGVAPLDRTDYCAAKAAAKKKHPSCDTCDFWAFQPVHLVEVICMKLLMIAAHVTRRASSYHYSAGIGLERA